MTDQELMTQEFGVLRKALEDARAKEAEQVKSFGSVLDETKAAQIELVKRLDQIEVKMAKAPVATDGPGLREELKANSDLEAMTKRGGGRCRFDLSAKAANEFIGRKDISVPGIGTPTYGVIPTERDAGIVTIARPTLGLRNVLPSRPTSFAEVWWVTESAMPTKASPVSEYSGLKPLAEPSFSTAHEPVQTIAILALASKQVLADWSELEGFLRSEMAYRVRQEEDLQIMSGDGSAPNLHGLTHQAQSWDISMLTASDGYEYADMILGAMKQIAGDNEESGSQFFVVNPLDAWKIRMIKDSTGRFIYWNPSAAPGPLTLGGAVGVETTQMTAGYFLVGSGSPRAAEIRDREGLTIELSTEDSTNFRYNLVTVRAELREALVVKRPDAFVYGAFTQSPA